MNKSASLAYQNHGLGGQLIAVARPNEITALPVSIANPVAIYQIIICQKLEYGSIWRSRSSWAEKGLALKCSLPIGGRSVIGSSRCSYFNHRCPRFGVIKQMVAIRSDCNVIHITTSSVYWQVG